MISVIFNGKETVLDGEIALDEFLSARGFDPAEVIVELNGAVMEGEGHGGLLLKDGDLLNVFRIVAGG